MHRSLCNIKVIITPDPSVDARQGAVGNPDEVRHLITKAYDHLLTAETSCNFFWGSRWVHRSFDDLEQTYHLLDLAMSQLGA